MKFFTSFISIFKPIRDSIVNTSNFKFLPFSLIIISFLFLFLLFIDSHSLHCTENLQNSVDNQVKVHLPLLVHYVTQGDSISPETSDFYFLIVLKNQSVGELFLTQVNKNISENHLAYHMIKDMLGPNTPKLTCLYELPTFNNLPKDHIPRLVFEAIPNKVHKYIMTLK